MTTEHAASPGNAATAFHCSADWHLIRLGKYALAVHSLMLRIQGDDLDFFGSVVQVAEYFGASRRHIRRAVNQLIKIGFVQKITARSGCSTIYRALAHKEWAERHPGQCAVKRDAAEQRRIEFDATENAPSDEVVGTKGTTTPSQKGPGGGHKRDHKSPKQSPQKSPRYDTAALTAAQSAYRLFCEDLGDEEEAFRMLLWVLYRAVSAKQIPQSLEYYRQADINFSDQHEYGQENILDAAYDRFQKHAYRYVETHSPELLAWLKQKSQQLFDERESSPRQESAAA